MSLGLVTKGIIIPINGDITVTEINGINIAVTFDDEIEIG